MQQDNKQKEINLLSWVFVGCIGIYFILMILVDVAEQMGVDLSKSTNILLFISELFIVLPGVIYIVVKKIGLKEIGFTKIKVATLFLSILLGFFIIPIASFVNIVSQFFVPNTLTQAAESLLSDSSSSNFIMILISSLFGPFCEEFMFRGVLASGYSKYSSFAKSMLLSSILFGLMHLNVNQLCYAFVIGLLCCIANRASGSIYTSLIIHIIMNAVNMIMLLITTFAMKMYGAEESLAEAAEQTRNSSTMGLVAVIYFVLAIVFGALFFGITYLIANVENRTEEFSGIFKKKKLKASNEENEEVLVEEDESGVKMFLTLPTIVGIVFCLFIMFGLEPLLSLFQ